MKRARPHREAANEAVQAALLNLRGISVIAGLRAATACAVPVIVGELTAEPAITWIAIAAFWACLADNGGSFRDRLQAMSGVTLFGTAGSFVGALVAGTENLPLAVLYAALVGFVGSFVRIFGSTATSVGLLVTTSVLVTLGMPPMHLAEIVPFTALYFAGGVWAMVLTLLIWRLHPYQPARAAIALAFEALADLAAAIAEAQHHPLRAHAHWDNLSLRLRRPSREAIESARQVLADFRRGRLGESGRGEGLILLLESADQIFLGLIGLSELLERTLDDAEHRRACDALVAMTDRLGPSLHAISALLLGRQAAPRARIVGDATIDTGARHTAELLASLLRLAQAAYDIAREVQAGQNLAGLIRNAAASGNEAARAALAMPAPQGRQLGDLANLARANMTWRSIAFRHAVRVAMTASLGVWLTQHFALERGYWLTVTAVVILQPYYATTWRRGIERVGGSVLGGLVAAALGIVLVNPLAIALAIFPLAAVASAFRMVNYGVFTFLLTPQFILIAELAQPGGGDLALAGLRALNSAGGGALAFVAGALLWPTRERRELPANLAAGLDAARGYFDAVLSRATGGDIAAPQIEQRRRRAGLASNNAEGSLDRLLSEPGKRSRDAEPAMAVVTSVRRIAGAVTALWVMPDLVAACRGVAELDAFVAWARVALAALSQAVAARTAPPPLMDEPTVHVDEGSAAEQTVRIALLRVARQIHILQGAIRRLTRQPVE